MKSLLLSLVLFTSAAAAVAQPIVIVVRHAEKEAGADPGLSASGHARAEMLARMLKRIGITQIFTSEFKRTQQTAAPLATALAITPAIIPAKDTAALVSRLRELNGNALVVGHGDTIPALLHALGIDTAVTIPEDDFGNIFVVELGEKPQLLQLRYP